jgi:DeoR family glycerol-3-phosphate regulon repressor
MFCPGDYDPHEGGVCGPETLAFLRRFHANKAFIGASALDEKGPPSDANPEAAWVKRAMLERSDRHLLLMDATKFGLRALDRICDLNALDDVIADAAPPRDLAREFTRAGIALRLA